MQRPNCLHWPPQPNSTFPRHDTTQSCADKPPSLCTHSSQMLSGAKRSTQEAVCKNTHWLSPVVSVAPECMRSQLQPQAELDVAHWNLLPRRCSAVCAGRHPAALSAFCRFCCHGHVCVWAVGCCCCNLLGLIFERGRGRRRGGRACMMGLCGYSCTLLLRAWTSRRRVAHSSGHMLYYSSTHAWPTAPGAQHASSRSC